MTSIFVKDDTPYWERGSNSLKVQSHTGFKGLRWTFFGDDVGYWLTVISLVLRHKEGPRNYTSLLRVYMDLSQRAAVIDDLVYLVGSKALAAHSHMRKKLGHDINLVIWLISKYPLKFGCLNRLSGFETTSVVSCGSWVLMEGFFECWKNYLESVRPDHQSAQNY